MSLAIRTRLYAARAISAQRPLQRLGRVEVGETMEGDLRLNLQQGVASVETLQAAVAHCGQARDFATGGILEGMTVHQAEDIDWLETQLETIRQIGIEEYLRSRKRSTRLSLGVLADQRGQPVRLARAEAAAVAVLQAKGTDEVWAGCRAVAH